MFGAGRQDAERVYYAIMCWATLAYMTHAVLSAVYRIQEAGLNPLQLVLVGTMLEAAALLFEVPTGVIADVYSRRLSIIIGVALIGVGYVIEGMFAVFGVILLAQVLAAAGYTFMSGAQQAWLSDEVGGEGVGRIYLRGAQYGQVGGIIGIALGTALGSLALSLPLIVGGALNIALALALIAFMPETGFSRTAREGESAMRAFGQTLRGGIRVVRQSRALTIILAVALIYGAATEPLDRLWHIHLLAGFDFPFAAALPSTVWFGIISAAAMLLGIGATELIRRMVDVERSGGAARALFGVNALLAVACAVFAFSSNFAVAVTAFLITGMLRRAIEPLMDAWINRSAASNVRATVFSIMGQGDALGQIAFGPLMGVVATAASIRIALGTVAALLLPTQALYGAGLAQRDE